MDVLQHMFSSIEQAYETFEAFIICFDCHSFLPGGLSVLVLFAYLTWDNEYYEKVSSAILVMYNVPHVIRETASEVLWLISDGGIANQYTFQVCAPSCHDCSTLRAWWEEDEERRCRFFKTMMGSDNLPPSQCVPEIVNFILRQHVESPSMWAIFPLQV